MAKSKLKTFFLCRNCGSMHVKWLGKWPDFRTWDSLDEVTKGTDDPHRPKALVMGGAMGLTEITDEAEESAAPRGRGFAELGAESVPVALADVPPLLVPRIATGVSELDRVLGG